MILSSRIWTGRYLMKHVSQGAKGSLAFPFNRPTWFVAGRFVEFQV